MNFVRTRRGSVRTREGGGSQGYTRAMETGPDTFRVLVVEDDALSTIKTVGDVVDYLEAHVQK